MAVNYRVQAQVVDIGRDTPKPSDVFLVDTNVWLWVSYTRSSQSLNLPPLNQVYSYPSYLKKALSMRAKVLRCGLSFSELSHQIENVEKEIYERTCRRQLEKKEFRHNYPAERAQVVAEVNAAWGSVKTMAEPLDVAIDDPTTDAALTRFQSQTLDGYDLFILEAMARAGIIQVLSNDGDFCTVPDIILFTANPRVVTAASDQGKLLVR